MNVFNAIFQVQYGILHFGCYVFQFQELILVLHVFLSKTCFAKVPCHLSSLSIWIRVTVDAVHCIVSVTSKFPLPSVLAPAFCVRNLPQMPGDAWPSIHWRVKCHLEALCLCDVHGKLCYRVIRWGPTICGGALERPYLKLFLFAARILSERGWEESLVSKHNLILTSFPLFQ